MLDLATIERNPPAIAPKAAKPPRISTKIKKAIRLLVSGECKTQKAAAARVGITDCWLSTQLNKPTIQAFVAIEARKTISQGVMRASARVIELVDASSEHVSLDASKHVLAIEGITPPDTRGPSVNINITPGYVIDLGGSSPVTIDAKPADEA